MTVGKSWLLISVIKAKTHHQFTDSVFLCGYNKLHGRIIFSIYNLRVVFVLKRRLAVFLSALILAVSLYIGAKLDGEYMQVGTSYGVQPTVIIDAGHGGLTNTTH